VAPLTARVLTEGQIVELDLGLRTQALSCRILGFGGDSVVLAPIREPSEATAEALVPAATAYLIVDAGGQVHALRARIGRVPDAAEIVVHVTDAFQLGQRRRYSRAPLALGARVCALPAGEEWATVTRDISAGGVRIARTGAAGEAADAVALVIEAAEVGLRISAQADVVRRTPLDVSLCFTAIEPQDAALLQQLALAYYRMT
jgi:hypothetical protein